MSGTERAIQDEGECGKEVLHNDPEKSSRTAKNAKAFNDAAHRKGERRSHYKLLFSFVSFAPLRFMMPDLG
jgi:hypothetical protein